MLAVKSFVPLFPIIATEGPVPSNHSLLQRDAVLDPEDGDREADWLGHLGLGDVYRVRMMYKA